MNTTITNGIGGGNHKIFILISLLIFIHLTDIRKTFGQVLPSSPQGSNFRLSKDGDDHTLIINGPCTNMGFEDGTFNGWAGTMMDRNTNGGGGGGPIVPGPVLPGFLQHCVMTAAMRDPLIPALPVVPPGKNFSVRVGNTVTGRLSGFYQILPI
jgi:hypothetical protein